MSALVKPYSQFRHKSYTLKTGEVTTLLAQLNTAQYRQSLVTLGLTELLANLTESQQVYEQLLANEATIAVNQIKYDMKQLKAEIYSTYRDLIDYCKVMGQITSDSEYQELLKVIDHSRNYYAGIVNRRKAAKKKEKTNLSQKFNLIFDGKNCCYDLQSVILR